jgi:hypothetical protein
MTENEKKNIQLARKYLVEEKEQLALDCYKAVYDANEDNAEAAYWVYTALWQHYVDNNEESNVNKRNAFNAVSNTLVKAVKEIAASEGAKDEKVVITARFVGVYALVAAYVVKNPITDASTRIQLAVNTLYAAGNAIESAYGSNDPDSMIVACMAWKDGVKLQQQFYAYSYDGNKAEDYVAKIQKHQPDYVMPKKAGCISVG